MRKRFTRNRYFENKKDDVYWEYDYSDIEDDYEVFDTGRADYGYSARDEKFLWSLADELVTKLPVLAETLDEGEAIDPEILKNLVKKLNRLEGLNPEFGPNDFPDLHRKILRRANVIIDELEDAIKDLEADYDKISYAYDSVQDAAEHAVNFENWLERVFEV